MGLHYQSFSSKSLVKVWPTLTEMLFTLSKLFSVFNSSFNILAGNSHYRDNGSYWWAVFCFCNLYFVFHEYQKAGDKTKESLDKRCCATAHKYKYVMRIMLLHYRNEELSQLILQGSLPNVYVYLFTFTCINFVSGFWLANSHQSPSKWCLHYQSLPNQNSSFTLSKFPNQSP